MDLARTGRAWLMIEFKLVQSRDVDSWGSVNATRRRSVYMGGLKNNWTNTAIPLTGEHGSGVVCNNVCPAWRYVEKYECCTGPYTDMTLYHYRHCAGYRLVLGCDMYDRGSSVAARGAVRVLSGPVHWHNVCDSHQTTEPLLQFQSHHTVRRHLTPSSSHVHSTARRGRKDRTRSVLVVVVVVVVVVVIVGL